MEFIKKNQYWVSLLSGIILSLAAYLFNPFGLDAVANKAVAIAVLMITWWITEALPMPAVALVPLILLPLMNVSSMEETAKAYSNPVIFLFMGGFMIG
ncbi:MAG: anion transporter, partial [Chitinophagaceae bacterium]|nr:anion transporter [Chitinophagaceae bacterium]